MNNSLESSKIFPYIAWATVIGFALFTYTLTMHLNAELDTITVEMDSLEMRLQTLESKAGNPPAVKKP